MKYFQLMNGNTLVGKYFTFEGRHLFTSKLPWEYQRDILWQAVTAYDDQPTPEQIVSLEDIEVAFGAKPKTLH